MSSIPALRRFGVGLSPRLTRLWPEVLLVGVSLALLVVTAFVSGEQAGRQPMDIRGGLLLLAAIIVLPWRHRFPAGVLAFALAATLTYSALDYGLGPLWLPLIAALITAVLAGRRREAIAAVVVGYIAFTWLGYALGHDDAPDAVELVALAGWLAALIGVGEAIRSQRDKARETARSHAEALRRRASDERLRIARELHDTVAHNMSLISIQAGVALHLLENRPEQARESLGTIKQASKEALVELRSILGVLRQVDDEAASDDESDAPRSPMPSLQRLDDLIDGARATGVEVRVEVAAALGRLSELPRNIDLAAYRIVQESLTNVARHSDTNEATVRLGRQDGELTVEVLDEGSAKHAGMQEKLGSGHGLTGMRERVASVGGRLEAGPRPGRGFAVRAWLPLSSESSEFTEGERV